MKYNEEIVDCSVIIGLCDLLADQGKIVDTTTHKSHKDFQKQSPKAMLMNQIEHVHSVAARGRHLLVNSPILISPICPTLGWDIRDW